MSLANKYRPTTFDTTVGQEHITDILKSKIKNSQQNNHNYLFFWPRWTWKTSVARILSKAMNCLDLQDGNPCNKCANCIAINEWKTLDYVEIDAASHTWVDNIREEILAKTDYPPTQLKKKIYVIDEVHMLSKGAFNALLKTIEEPKDYMSFILATTEIEKVPETIVSRCQVFNFKKIPADKMVARLQEICKQENLGYENEALDLIERMAEWCARDAVKYIDQVSVFGDISVKNVTNLLWIVGDSTIKEFLEIIKSWDRANIFTRVDEIHSQWIDLAQFAKQVIMYIDHHLMEDVEFFLKISEFFGEILSMIRYYPYPNMVYKIVLNKCVSGDETQVEMKKEKPSKVILNETKWSEESIWSKQDSSVASLSQNDKKEQSVETPKNDTVETKKVEQQSEINDELFSKIWDQIDSKTLQHGLKNFVHVKSVTDWKIELIVIDKMAEITLKKEENQKLLEQKILENTGKAYSLDIEYMDKDAYFSQMML